MTTTVVHHKRDPCDVYIGRPGPWGNPFPLRPSEDRMACIERYRDWLMEQPELLERAKRELRGQLLGCWCSPKACHGHVLAALVDGLAWDAYLPRDSQLTLF